MKILRLFLLAIAVLEVTSECWPGLYSNSYEDCDENFEETLLSTTTSTTTVK